SQTTIESSQQAPPPPRACVGAAQRRGIAEAALLRSEAFVAQPDRRARLGQPLWRAAPPRDSPASARLVIGRVVLSGRRAGDCDPVLHGASAPDAARAPDHGRS